MSEIEQLKVEFFEILNERQQRLFAGLEALQIGRQGVPQTSELLGIHPHTIRSGKADLRQLPNSPLDKDQVRLPGGGRKKNHDSPS